MRPRVTAWRVVAVTGALGVVALAVLAVAALVGVEPISLGRALADRSSSDAVILLHVRLPRVLLGAVTGAALSASGVALQALLRNPLADPYILGVSAGAAVGGTAAIVLGLATAAALPAWAFAGAVLATALVYAVGRVEGRLYPTTVLLTGVVFSAFAAALILFLRLLVTPARAHEVLFWLTGYLGSPQWSRLAWVSGYVMAGLALLVALAPAMNALAMGEEGAHSLGIPVERTRRVLLLASSLLTGAVVALSGPIGFVGIIVPHAVRLALGPDHRLLVPASAIAGAAFLVACDLVARMLFLVMGTEPTVGVLTALAGGPFFLVLLRRRGARRAS